MKIIYFLFLITLIVCDELYQKEKDVLLINEENFGFAMTEFKYLLLLFYSPDDPNCQEIIPIYEKTASILKKENFVCGKINADKSDRIVSHYNAQTIPSIILLKKGSAINYDGEKTPEKILEWLKEQTKKEYKKIKSNKDFEEFKKQFETTLVYFGKNEQVMNEITLAIRKIDDIPIGSTDSDDLIKEFSESDDKKEFIILFTKFDKGKNYLYDLKSDKIIKFYYLYCYPKVIDFNTLTAPILFAKRFKALVIFSLKTEKHWEESQKLLEKVWPKLNTKLKLFTSNIDEGVSIKLSEYCGVKEKDLPKAFIIEPVSANPIKYALNEKLTEENLLKFVEDWENKKLKPFLRSEEEPEENDGDVFIVVGKTFKKEVLDNDKDVIVLFFAPWCKYCKHFYPGYERLARQLKNKNPKLLFAKMDATENDIEAFPINKYPTVKFYPGNAKNKEPLHFSNKQGVDDLLASIKRNAYHKVNDEDYVSQPEPEFEDENSDL
jgi:protein disulfide-isomerase A1